MDNNEYNNYNSNNNQPDDSNKGDQYSENLQPHIYNQPYGNNSYMGNVSSANSYIGSGYSNAGDPYSAYSSQQDNHEKGKAKKKHRLAGAAKLTAAAVAFGLIAGGVFQGFGYFAQPNEKVIIEQTGSSTPTDAGTKTAVNSNTGKDASVVPVNNSPDAVVTDVSDIVAKVMPSIVAIDSSATQTGVDIFGRQFNQPVQASGSGIIIGQDDKQILIVTNNHVIQNEGSSDYASEIKVKFSDETTASATVKGADANADLAVLSINKSELSDKTASAIKVATLGNSDNVKPGEMAIAIGNALGYGQSVTVGYISALNREVSVGDNTMKLLQTDAAINPGNSGGALINTAGEVIGINSVKYASAEVEGMGYAIPISHAIPMINELMNRQTIAKSEQGYLGIDAASAQNVTDVTAQSFHMPVGVYVNVIIKGSPAEKAGLKSGNIIVGVNDTTIKTVDDLANALSFKKAGDTISLKINVLENGEYVEKSLSVTLGTKPSK